MRRAAAVLASIVALAGTGCAPTPIPPFTDVTFYWNFQDMDGNVFGNWAADVPGCGIANVDQIRLTAVGPAGTITQTVPCLAAGNFFPGATFTNMPTGPYEWTIEGLRLGFPVYSVAGNATFVDFPSFYVTALAEFPNMDLWYQLPIGQTCAGIAEIAFQLDNLDGGVVEYSWQNVLVRCQAPPNNGFTMPSIPVGNYGYRFISAVNAPMPGGQAIFQVCGFGYTPPPAVVQTWPNGNAYTAPLGFAIGTCP